MPSTKNLAGPARDLALYARRILRGLRGILQGKNLKGLNYNSQLLAIKKSVS